MIKTKTFIASIIFSLVIPSLALADTATSTLAPDATATTTSLSNLASSTAPSVLGLQAPPVPLFIVAIKQAKLDLASVKLNYELDPVYTKPKATKKNPKPKAVIGSYNLTAKDIALAILDPATNQVGVTLGMQTGKTIKFSDPNFDVALTRFNGVNSAFKINKPSNGTVLALKYLITGPEKGSKAAITNALSEAIYVPYSSNINQPDIIAYGENYISDIIKRAANELSAIPSRAVPGKSIPEAIRPALIRALVYAEHSDTNEVLTTTDLQGTINRLNILFATNEGDAYKYSVSTAGARGIAQFIPSTYKGLVERRPEANLIPDFVAGMSDHYNSIKAMYLLLDDYAGAVRVKTISGGFVEGQVFDYGAASYNGGVTRVTRALKAFGNNWNQDQSAQINALKSQISSLKLQVKNAKDKKTKANLQAQLNTANSQLTEQESGSLRNETVNYLKKIYKVIPLFNNSEQI